MSQPLIAACVVMLKNLNGKFPELFGNTSVLDWENRSNQVWPTGLLPASDHLPETIFRRLTSRYCKQRLVDFSIANVQRNICTSLKTYTVLYLRHSCYVSKFDGRLIFG